jgi:glycosyltransferase involved in cell wall biosynthesis
VSFGTELSQPIPAEKQKEAERMLRDQLQVPDQTLLLLFNGAFKYAPNREALDNILYKINPLLQEKNLSYLILILGLNIPEEVMKTNYPSVRILGFVEDLDRYLAACRIFLNPVISGGGIKTKLVEALAYGLSSVSSENGAVGIDPGLCNQKLILCPDGDWPAFADAVVRLKDVITETPAAFYDLFYWENITKRAACFIE